MATGRSNLPVLVPAPWGNQEDRSWPAVPRRVRAKNASRACSECQKRKIKCVGSNPCRNCEENSLYCEVNDETDGRRRTALKRKVEDLEQDRDILVKLVETLRHDDQHALKLFNLIRSNASLDDIRLAVESRSIGSSQQASASSSLLSLDYAIGSQMSTSPAPGATNEHQSNHSSMHRQIMDIDRLTDIPLFEVPAQPWTSVTKDSAFVSHLISLWLTWDHVCRNWIDQDLFIKAMRSGDVDSPFCSPFLVNSILSQACLYSNYPEAFVDPSDLSTRGQHFYNEAKRHLDAMEGRVNLTSVQGVGILYFNTCLMGKDRVGLYYMSQTCLSIRELVTQGDESIAAAGPQGEDLSRSIEICVRGLFSFLSSAGLSLQTPVPMKPPPRKHLPVTHDPNDTWTAYPQPSTPEPAHRNCIHNQAFDMNLIVYDILEFFYSDKEKYRRDYCDVEKTVQAFDVRLLNWLHQLPACISAGQYWTPGVLELHFLKSHPSVPREAYESAHSQCVNSVRTVRDLTHVHRTKWRRIEHMPLEYTQVITFSLFTLLDDLDSTRSREAFVDLVVLARSMARRCQLSKGMLRLVQVTARQERITLPDEVGTILHEFEVEWYRGRDLEKFSSYYPNFPVSLRGTWRTNLGHSAAEGDDDKDGWRRHGAGGRERSAELDLFLRKWDDFSLEDSDKQASRSIAKGP